MSASIPPNAAVIILRAFFRSNRDKSLSDVLSSFPAPQPNEDRVRQWVRNLVTAEVLGHTETPSGTRYWATVNAPEYLRRLERQIATPASNPAPTITPTPALNPTTEDTSKAASPDSNTQDGSAAENPVKNAAESTAPAAQKATPSEQPRATDSGVVTASGSATDSMPEASKQTNPPAPAPNVKTGLPAPSISGHYEPNEPRPVPPKKVKADCPTAAPIPVVSEAKKKPKPEPARGETSAADVEALLTKVLSPETLANVPPGELPTGWRNLIRQAVAWAVDRIVPAGQPAWLKALIIGVAGALILLISTLLIGDGLAFAITHKGATIIGLALVLAGAIFFARKRSAPGANNRTPKRGEKSTSRATDSAQESPAKCSEIDTVAATEIERSRATQSDRQAGGSAAVVPVGARGIRKHHIVVALNVIVIGVAAWSAWSWYSRRQPSSADIRGFLSPNLGSFPAKIAALDVRFLTSSATGISLTYNARIATTEPLFSRLKSDDYLRAKHPAEYAEIVSAGTILEGSDGARIRAKMAGVTTSNLTLSPTDFLSGLVLLNTTKPAGYSVLESGALTAWKESDGWRFSGAELNITALRKEGEPRPSGPLVFVIDSPADVARLDTLIAELSTYARTVQQTPGIAAPDVGSPSTLPAQNVADVLRSGMLFSGTATSSVGSDSHFALIEITAASTGTQRVSALLRNDGGWSDARAFEGEWTAGQNGLAELTLRTRNADRILGAGPMLDEPGDWSLVLHFRPDGTATVSPGNWIIRPLDSVAAVDAKTKLTRAVSVAVVATKTGVIYRGTATSRPAGKAEALVLRFLDQNGDGSLLLASLESATHAGEIRPFHGTILGNSYRAGSTPIRLRSSDNERAVNADPNSLLGLNSHNDSLAVSLRADGSHLVGEDDRFTYDFERSDAPNPVPDKADSGSPGAPKVVFAPTPSATAGTGAGQFVAPSIGARNDGGQVASDKGLIPNVSSPDQRATMPPVSGRPLDGSTAQPAVRIPPSDAASISNPESENPTQFPSKSGAYVLAAGKWQPLPRNNGRNVQTYADSVLMKTVSTNLEADASAGRASSLSTVEVAHVAFNGTDPVTTVPPGPVILVYVGKLTAVPPETLNKYPLLRTYPVVELARLTTVKNGVRQAPLVLVAPGFIGYGAARVSATVEQPQDGVAVLRTAEPLAPGLYAFACGSQAYELKAE